MKSKTAPTLVAPQPAIAPTPALPLALRRYLYITATITGAAVMIVEILGAKMLSPYVGLSHFVWTAQIAVTLVALACGYYAGGKLADRTQQLPKLYWALLGAAAYLSVTVLICERVAYWCLDFNLAVGSLLASTILFFVPLALLAMTCPFLVRIITSSVTGVGGNVGRLTSISTVGSFVGTMLIGYVAIPLLPNSFTMFATSGLLFLACAVYFGFFHRKVVAPLVALAVMATAIGLEAYHERTRDYKYVIELFRGNSHFGQLQVIDARETSARYYLNDNLYQNTFDPERKQSRSAFTYLLAGLARAYTTNIQDVLCIGMGMGIVPMDFARQGARVDVVEINPAVVPVAQKFFNFDPSKVTITIDDGRHYLNRCRKKYDVIILDAFLGDSSPSHLLTHEAFAAMAHVLRPGGTLSINSFGDLEAGRDYFTASLAKTLKSVFAGVRIHDCGNGGIFFAATDRPDPVFVHEPDLNIVHPEARKDTAMGYADVVQTDPRHGRVLTDNYNPVEFYDARNREEIRRRLAASAKEM